MYASFISKRPFGARIIVAGNFDELSTESLLILADGLEDRLLDTPIYRDLLTIRKILAERHGGPVGVPSAASTTPDTAYKARIVRLGRITAIGAAIKALEAAGRPMNIHELVEAVPKYGFEIKANAKKKPASLLSTYLNKRGGKSPLVSIWLNNKPVWWFRDRPVPGAEVA